MQGQIEIAAMEAQAQQRRRRADREHDLFGTIVEEAFSEILAFDAETLGIILANRSARNNLGYNLSEIVGMNVADLKVEFTAAHLKEIYRPLLDGETAKMVMHTLQRRKDGSAYPAEIHSRISQFAGRPMIFQIVIDQTEIKRAHKQAELASLVERDAAEASDSRAFLARLLGRLGRQIGSQIAHAYLWRKETGRLEPSGIWHVEEVSRWQAGFQKATEATSFLSGESLAGEVHAKKQPVLKHNLGDDTAVTRNAVFARLPVSTGFAMPVFVDGEVAAVLEFFSDRRMSIEVWPDMTETIGEQISRLYARKCAEEDANESRERFDAAVNGAAVGLWDYNYKSGLFYLSPLCREILHITDDAAAPGWTQFGQRIHTQDARHTAAAMSAHVRRRTPYDVEYRYRLDDGRYIWVRSRARGVWDEEGAIIRTAGTIEDITAKKEGEIVQREVLACIANGSDTDAKITQALDRMRDYLGLETAMVSRVSDGMFDVRYRASGDAGPALGTAIPLAQTICSDVYSGDVLCAFPDLADSPAANHPARMDTGAYIGTTLFVKGVRFGTLSFSAARARKPFDEAETALVNLLARWIGEEIGRALDVSEWMEKDLRISAKLASAADALLTVDGSGRIEDANPAAIRMFGWLAEELRQMQIAALLPTAPSFSHPDGRLISVKLRQDVAIRKGGQRLAVLLNVSEVRLGAGTHYTVAISDLTQVKQAEVAKEEFISVVSHELRTPLTSIMGALSLIASQTMGALTPETAKLADVAQRNCDRLLRLVNDILAIEKLESGQFEMSLEPLDVESLLRDAIAANAPYATKFDTAFELSLPQQLPLVVADGERLTQVMANLLSNAAKFTRPGTRIDVSAGLDGRFVQIAVRDCGQGIPEAIRGRIFEKFTQGERANIRGCEGSGLGLSIARQMMELMNGEIGFVSQEGVGTTFTIRLPIAELNAGAVPDRDVA